MASKVAREHAAKIPWLYGKHRQEVEDAIDNAIIVSSAPQAKIGKLQPHGELSLEEEVAWRRERDESMLKTMASQGEWIVRLQNELRESNTNAIEAIKAKRDEWQETASTNYAHKIDAAWLKSSGKGCVCGHVCTFAPPCDCHGVVECPGVAPVEVEGAIETMLASESVLEREWNTPEENSAWKDLAPDPAESERPNAMLAEVDDLECPDGTACKYEAIVEAHRKCPAESVAEPAVRELTAEESEVFNRECFDGVCQQRDEWILWANAMLELHGFDVDLGFSQLDQRKFLSSILKDKRRERKL